jgi:predicted GNAT family N-acyltransferase
VLEEQALDATRHDRSGFQCGEPALDEYLRKYAVQQSAKGISSVFVLVDDAQANTILGFYTLSAAQIDTAQLSDAERKKLPRYPVPCFRMGRLARSMEHRGAGMGAMLIGLAVDRCLKARALVGAYALLVDAKNEKAAAFYQHYGFAACADSPMALYLPLG